MAANRVVKLSSAVKVPFVNDVIWLLYKYLEKTFALNTNTLC
jgi:hypothetical protein